MAFQNLVWSGFGAAGPGSAHAPHVCNYEGSPHLCYFQGVQMLGYGWGHGVIMDNSYRFVRSVEAAGHQAATDEHEFLVLPDGKSALVTVYERKQYDLCDYGIKHGLGFIQEGVFQEVDIESGKLLFEWKSLDHIPPSESFVLPGTTEISGDGYTRDSPWDYFHINSIDKNKDGDYLISARHVSGVYKISGKDGSVLWRLGGLHSSFNQDFNFSSQHDARFLSDNDTHTVISVFDNASNGFNYTKDFSEGMTISIDHATKEATCLQTFNAPDPNGGIMAKSQGNMQVLPNGNAMVGWGNNAFFTEFTSDGTAIWHAWIATTGTMVYRFQKFNWTGMPNTVPALYTYSQHGKDLVFYMSWNGATEIRSWGLYTSHNKEGPYQFAESIPKDGFETAYRYHTFYEWSYVEALDAGGVRLCKSEPEKTYIPGPDIMPFCNDYACADAAEFPEEEPQIEEATQGGEELEQKLETQRSIKHLGLIVLDVFGGIVIGLGLALYCGGKVLRRKLWVWYQDIQKAIGEYRDGGLGKYGLRKWDYRRLGSGGTIPSS